MQQFCRSIAAIHSVDEMRALTPDEIQTALSRLQPGLDRYLWLQHHVRLRDVSTDEEFQRCFCRFYRVRRDFQWRPVYFGLLESSKVRGIDFPAALREINRRTHRIEASFASKLVATLDPTRPVIDQFVLHCFGLRLPTFGTVDREAKTVAVYDQLCAQYETFMHSPTAAIILERFEDQYPGSNVTPLKKLDLVLWQIRP
jgi:hypothetical protein